MYIPQDINIISKHIFYTHHHLDHPLDATAIHPENYQQALDLLNLCQLSLADLGTVELKDKLLKIKKKKL